MVCVQNCVRNLPIHTLRVQGWVEIAATCWVSWWLGVRRGPISRIISEVTQCIGLKRSDSLMFSLTVLQHFSDACVVIIVGTVCMIYQNIVLGPQILHCPCCVASVLIPNFSTYCEFLFYHSLFRVLFFFLVVWLGFFLNHDVRPPVCSCSFCIIALKFSQ